MGDGACMARRDERDGLEGGGHYGDVEKEKETEVCSSKIVR